MALVPTIHPTQIISYTPDSISFGSPQFGERVGFTATMPSTNLSLYINNTQESDSGRYLCQVIIPGAMGLTGELSLNVNGKDKETPYAVLVVYVVIQHSICVFL